MERIGRQIAYLRHAYRTERLDGPPHFGDETTRLAYAAAYHPGHAFAYLHLLLRRNLGNAAFGGLKKSPKVLVLGAGPGAETLAIMRWMEAERPELLLGARFVLVDRAEWGLTRRSVLTPTVMRSWRSNRIVFDQVTSDITADEGMGFLAAEVPNADVIFCPSIVSELISDRTQGRVLESLVSHMSRDARLVLIDHKDVEFEHVSRQWSHRFNVVEEGVTLGAILPHPTMWVASQLLDGSENRIPTRSYPLLWSVLAQK